MALIRQMARDNLLWGAERIRGELLKLDIEGSKRTIQKYMPKERRQSGQTWTTTFLVAHEPAHKQLGSIGRRGPHARDARCAPSRRHWLR